LGAEIKSNDHGVNGHKFLRDRIPEGEHGKDGGQGKGDDGFDTEETPKSFVKSVHKTSCSPEKVRLI
jgi:hypothetical protein